MAGANSIHPFYSVPRHPSYTAVDVFIKRESTVQTLSAEPQYLPLFIVQKFYWFIFNKFLLQVFVAMLCKGLQSAWTLTKQIKNI